MMLLVLVKEGVMKRKQIMVVILLYSRIMVIAISRSVGIRKISLRVLYLCYRLYRALFSLLRRLSRYGISGVNGNAIINVQKRPTLIILWQVERVRLTGNA